jgi:hypothetical protein
LEKIPDPHETWQNFYNRIMKFELYRPPLVNKESVPEDKRNNLFMKIQTRLLEIEYDKKSKNIFFYFILFYFISLISFYFF